MRISELEQMIQAEAERVVDVYLDGCGQTKVNVLQIISIFDVNSIDVTNEIYRRIRIILNSEGVSTIQGFGNQYPGEDQY